MNTRLVWYSIFFFLALQSYKLKQTKTKIVRIFAQWNFSIVKEGILESVSVLCYLDEFISIIYTLIIPTSKNNRTAPLFLSSFLLSFFLSLFLFSFSIFLVFVLFIFLCFCSLSLSLPLFYLFFDSVFPSFSLFLYFYLSFILHFISVFFP